MVPLLQSSLPSTALNDYRLGQILDALFAANLHWVLGAVALKALEVYAMLTPWLHQDTTTITLYGAYAEEPHPGAGPEPPRPAYAQSALRADSWNLTPVLRGRLVARWRHTCPV
jgi:hypothetical protein